MKRLKIPKSMLKGSPLTIEEQKQILGGLMERTTRSCMCYFTYNASCSDTSNCASKKAVAADSEYTCSEKCHALCDNNPACITARYGYSAYE